MSRLESYSAHALSNMISRFRLRLFAWHLAGSSLVICAAAFWVYLVWYPAPLDVAVGVTRVFVLLLAIDLILGPSLTFLVAREGKRTLAFDLSVILFLQLGALGYGLHSVAEGRPVWLVFNVDRFDVVRSIEIDRRALSDASETFKSASLFGPQWVGAVGPTDADARTTLLFEAALAGVDLPHRPNYYVPLSDVAHEIKARARPLEDLISFNEAVSVQRSLSRLPEADGWLPLASGAQDMVVLISKHKAEVIGTVDLRPWE